ncbi:hypothetical protein G6F56_014176 [Rhizopus delemar]|nr:hypothetical protein G6F56_014176 [Rhizopus delemar]
MDLEDMTNSKNKRKQLSSFVWGQIVGMHMLNGKATQISSILNIPSSTTSHQENDNLTNKIANLLATFRGYKETRVCSLMMNLHKLNKVKT